MPLYKETGAVADPWSRLADDVALPADGPVLVSFARWRAARPDLLAWREPIGVAATNTDEVEELAPDVARLDLIALSFPKYTDGRAYSQARLLRGRYDYHGELRATGDVLRDQLPFMLRCGFNSFESDQPGFGDALAHARTLFSVVYQPTEDGRTPISVLRRQGQTAPTSS